MGAAIQTARVWPGATVAVIGLGGIGLSAMQGAGIAGAARLIAIDIAKEKLGWAPRFGATDVVDACAPSMRSRRSASSPAARASMWRSKRPASLRASVRPSRCSAYAGIAVAIGVPPIPSDVHLPWSGSDGAAYGNKASLLITDGGDPIPAEDFPEMAGWYLDGRLDLDGMVTRVLELHELDEAFRAMLAGEVIRSVVRLGDE